MKTKLLSSFLFLFTVLIFAQAPVNDDCAMAINIPIETANAINISYNNTDATLSVSGSCENNTYVDIWYEFTMPVTGNVRLTGAYGNDSFSLYDACNGTEIQCGFGNEYYFGLQQNTNYRLRVASRIDLIAARSFNIQAFVPTVNNECLDAINLPVEIANSINTSYNNAGSTLSISASCENNTYADLWYEFTMPVTGNIRLTGTYGNDSFTLYDACNGTEIQCGFGNEYYFGLQQNTNYKLRVASRLDLIAPRSFNIQAFVPTVNNECADAINLPIETANSINTTYNNAGSTLSVSASCENNTYADLWYEFTMPITGNVRLTGTYGNDSFTLYNACNGTEIQCGFGNEYYFGLQQNTNYKLRVASRVDLAAPRSFNIQAFVPTVNNECADAINLPIVTANSINTSYSNAGSTLSISASCENNTYADLWFEFTMPVTGNVRLTGAYGNDSFTLYDACNGTEIQCGFGNEYYYSLQQNTNYKLRVASRLDLIAPRSFNIQAFTPTVNDECVNADNLILATANAITVNYSNQGSTFSEQGSCENPSSNYIDQWFTFNMPVTGNVEISGAYGNDSFALFDACGGNEIQCGFGNENYLNLTENTDYVLRVSSREDLAAPRSFNIQAFGTVSNDECVDAETIAVQTLNPVSVSYNTAGATASSLASCESTSFVWQDIWYQFTMPENGNLILDSANGNTHFTLYNVCNGTELQCGAGDEIYLNLSQSTGYVLKVSSRADLTVASSFTLQAFESIPNDTCATALPIQVAASGDCATQNNVIDMRGATPATLLGSCLTQTQEYYDAWFSFDAPLTGNIFLNTTEVFDIYTVYDVCNGTEISCASNDQSIPVTFGTNYLLQLQKRTPFLNEVTFCLEGSPAVAPGIVSTCEVLPSIEISTTEGNINDWVPIFDTSNNIVAEINANGNDLGTVNSTLFIDANDVRTSGTQPYLRREVSITPQTQPTSNVDIRLYVLEDEMLDLIAADTNLPNALLLDFMKVDGTTCTSGYTSGGDFIDASTTVYGDDYYIQSSIPDFSVFYPTSTNLSSTLSVETFDNVLGLSIYPTVSNGIINIKSENNLGNSKLSVFDLNGRLIQTSEVKLGSNPIQINLENASKGLYFLKIENNGNINTHKIILK